jgi:ribosome-associated translation inhibitor RaiA
MMLDSFMNLKEINDAIRFKEHRSEDRIIVFARLELGGAIHVDTGYEDLPGALDAAKEKLRRQILRRLYEDRREEFYKLVTELVGLHPYSTRFYEVREALMGMAEHCAPR